jgi:hypothetical protein
MGNLAEREGSVQLTSLYYFRSAPLCIENIIYFRYKTSKLNEEIKCTKPFPTASVT